ncbi:MAG: peptidase M23B [Candidatus Gottesmanbacteria bacterium GW2011_GWA2_43_14]|uniref:Peptidase M23B n=1 Tax=Candidatus Gottesmanbacteria bacterium GW2011_GWA2_43_14 TaxID=1618443 RepID=A0A0G1DCU6_9BACT|nr:MAG: peptidase M23B [Candidatus Gottesmanbacteria bacterium GW2011_GWA2_43_14]
MLHKIQIFIFTLLILLSSLWFVQSVRADELSDLEKKLSDLKHALQLSVSATTPLEKNLDKLKQNLTEIQNRIKGIEAEVARKEKDVSEGEELLGVAQELLSDKVRKIYITSTQFYTQRLFLIFGKNLSEAVREFGYQKKVIENDRDTIVKVVLYIKDLEQKKADLEKEKVRLAAIKKETDEQADFLGNEIEGAKKYQNVLSSQIAQLSARQQQLVSQRLASLNIPRSAGSSVRGCSDDRDIDPGFSPRIAFFTYGAPHRNGLNQYGAWGRAKKGQNEEKILQEYYPGLSLKKDYDRNVQISTTTGWSGSIEDYVKRIYEVPDSWTDNNMAVLKAQAVAARSYALNVTQNGSKPICTTEQCQVFKPDPKGGNWEQAVNFTSGWVLMDGGGPGFTQYASTHGGYILNLGKFDGEGGNPGNFSELNDRAYDKESPWFYCDWGAREKYAKTAWLKAEEVADIVNVILLTKHDNALGEHLYQTDKPHPYGGETWNEERVKQELASRNISAYDSVSDLSVSVDFGSGKTTSVNINGNAGSQNFDASEFKNFFNLRAPANIQIVGPLYNIERK